MNIAGPGMARMAAAAAGFAIHKATGDKLIADLEPVQEQVDEALRNARGLARPTRLGQLPEAQATAQLKQDSRGGRAIPV